MQPSTRDVVRETLFRFLEVLVCEFAISFLLTVLSYKYNTLAVIQFGWIFSYIIFAGTQAYLMMRSRIQLFSLKCYYIANYAAYLAFILISFPLFLFFNYYLEKISIYFFGFAVITLQHFILPSIPTYITMAVLHILFCIIIAVVPIFCRNKMEEVYFTNYTDDDFGVIGLNSEYDTYAVKKDDDK